MTDARTVLVVEERCAPRDGDDPPAADSTAWDPWRRTPINPESFGIGLGGPPFQGTRNEDGRVWIQRRVTTYVPLEPAQVDAVELLDEAIALASEFNAQWGDEYIAKKYHLPDELKALIEKRAALRSRPAVVDAELSAEQIKAAWTVLYERGARNLSESDVKTAIDAALRSGRTK